MTAHIYPKGKTWYVYLYYTEKLEGNDFANSNSRKKKGKKHQKWFNTHLPLRGNARRADKIKEELLAYWKPILEPDDYVGDQIIPFPDRSSDFLAPTVTQRLPDKTYQINALSIDQDMALSHDHP